MKGVLNCIGVNNWTHPTDRDRHVSNDSSAVFYPVEEEMGALTENIFGTYSSEIVFASR
jgi:hypothetical protein